ncbi:hypothetical protein A3I27_02840 [Candidatus Giovannonibacteria bacterium RIFCSPLOWO2_02_FULL_43_11b]|uniref:Cytotoxin n=1 Tax=Candidatus Giovannonibacteria bacterium RIFCSPHIGHO2_12_FULL_43_15 TaxID=1798341 RepID=A0A1F5WQY9_9BACT|nr:MAG: hypothetical protein A2739_00075 [Candidatus Giovannonibacteria bacterium RIFCSPHIGHO2_01_FULL_43_100]OGF66102.1 MAG: hypothetical protein A3B97_01195 [Candidatus Giovannonibacteria bacterium RIFCSPHIGHO2_02_FULL_43_32]OGF78078.1 MAG: hypothetical protein A3F23_02650 [Candidatus Giovannonibacteria bacterium RIFCSPHIGHO2_12_FULL_43_15]OGF78821.1 MAG: hypothetical protein A3A15_00340 [Candidatus Giovannonibacteria bacterium RIFCSPLOWO2_01_FULL_43_60]OGF89146.1 MAG: hypothetical protein A3
MRILFSEPFKKNYKALHAGIKKALDKALTFLSQNPRHHSLRFKKLHGTDIWYGRITREYRFTANYQGDIIILRRAGTHKILNKERK